MAIVFGEIDCLENLIGILIRNGIRHIKSLNDVIAFKNDCDEKVKEAEVIARQEHHSELVQKRELITAHKAERSIVRAGESFVSRFFRYLVFRIKLFKLNRELNRLERKSEGIILKKVSQMTGPVFKLKHLLDSNYTLIQGAFGEQQALEELRRLPDTYYVINNVRLRFSKPIYNRRSRQRIYTVQADHIVVGSTGVFVIETKNWSKDKIINETGFTAFDQVKRTNFAIFCFLNPRSTGLFSLFIKSKKISVRSILLMIGHNTEERDPFVKVARTRELFSYITHFPSVMTDVEIHQVFKKLVP